MKSLCLSLGLALAATMLVSERAEAQYPSYAAGALGFYNPYTFPPSTSVRTPPYFAVHPPVYYSTRHARPYGMSPFAAPPMVAPADNYQGRQASEFVPQPLRMQNPYCHISTVLGADEVPASQGSSDWAIGEIQQNPYAGPSRVAAR